MKPYRKFKILYLRLSRRILAWRKNIPALRAALTLFLKRMKHPRLRRILLRRIRLEPVFSSLKSRRTLKLALVAGAVLIGVTLWKKTRPVQVDASALRPDVRTVQLKPGPLLVTIDGPGTIVQLEKAAVTSRVIGRLQAFHAEQGDSVRKGQKLAQIETFDLEIKKRQALAALNQARARLELTRARYDASRRGVERQMKGLERASSNIIESRATYLNSRQSLLNLREIYEMGGASSMELKSSYAQYLSLMSRYYQSRVDYQTGLIGFRNQDLLSAGIQPPSDEDTKKKTLVDFNTQVERGEVDVARSSLETARLDVETVELMIREASISSPIAGVVAVRNLEIGEEVKQGEPLFVVVRMDKLLVSLSVPEDQMASVVPGLEASFSVDALGGKKLDGKVHRISPVLDTKTRSAEAQILFDNKDLKISPGMFARASIVLAKRENALSLPDSALSGCRRENAQALCDVFVVQKALAFKRTVVTGLKSQGRVEVLGGLKAGETVAVSSVSLLRDGLEVREVREP